MKLFQPDQQILLKKTQPKYEIEFHLTIDSTNTRCRQLAQKNSQIPWAVLADQQNKGRGRRGKSWESPSGCNIYISLCYQNTKKYSVASLNFYFAVLWYEVLLLSFPDLEEALILKWPNDIYLEDKKLGGILLENIDNSLAQVIVGMGLNIHSMTADLPPVGTSLRQYLGKDLGENCRSELISKFLQRISEFPLGTKEIQRKFQQFSQKSRHKNYTYTYGSQNFTGSLQTIHEDGSASILTKEGLKRIV